MGREKSNIKQREWNQLDEKERYKIEALVQRGIKASEISKQMGRDRRTIEREIKIGTTLQRDSEWREKRVYPADVGQRKHVEKSGNKGKSLKIGYDHKLAKHIVNKIKNENWSPDAIIGEI